MAENVAKNGEIVAAEAGEGNRASKDLVVKTIPEFPKTLVGKGTGQDINLPKVERYRLLTVDVVDQKATQPSPLFSATQVVCVHPLMHHDAGHGNIRNGGHGGLLLFIEDASGIPKAVGHGTKMPLVKGQARGFRQIASSESDAKGRRLLAMSRSLRQSARNLVGRLN